MMNFESLFAVLMGVGLAAACGMRVFMPLLALAVGARLGLVHAPESMAWMASWPALIALATACAAEVAGYYVPWIDHALDTLATPAAAVAGAAAMFMHSGWALDGLHPMATWGASLIGGGVATTIQAGTVAARATSTATTGGLANPIFATIENIGAAVLSALAIVIPIVLGVVGAVILLAILLITIKLIRSRRSRVAAIA